MGVDNSAGCRTVAHLSYSFIEITQFREICNEYLK